MTGEIFDTIREYRMIEAGMRVIAGVSGGADSVCLLHVLMQFREQMPFELFVVHVEHGLRGQDSLDDAAFVEKLCDKWQLPCCVVSAEVNRRAAAEGLSTEEAGRAERYRIFEEIAEEWGASRIAVAHNQDDQAETVIWNLVRGSGLRGLGGIRPVQGKIIRPLIFTPRTDIEAYLRETGLTWRTDRTNLEPDYTRNRIRLSILPMMEKELNAQAGRHIAEAAGRLQKVQEYLDQRTDEAAVRCIEVVCAKSISSSACSSKSGTLAILRISSYVKEEPLIRQELLRRVLETCGGLKNVGAVHLEMLDELARMDCGKSADLPGGIRVVREDGILRFERMRPATLKKAVSESGLSRDYEEGRECGRLLAVPGCTEYGSWHIETELLENYRDLKNQFLGEKKYTKWLSYDTIKNSLQLRTRKSGDYLIIDAHGGRKKLKDYFIDQKIPRTMRDQILLLADGAHILWVIGWRISEAAKVTEDTRQVLKVQVREA